ncbi:response regulator [Sphingomonas ginsenosidivorax]|nr:response regulator [Sphingomonas ginsenosidivorax]
MKDLTPPESIGVSLVDGDSDIRHARQIMLRSERYDVRAYATCAALLADPRSRDYGCIIVDTDMPQVDGLALLRAMRASGWRGKGILLDGLNNDGSLAREAARNGDTVFDRNIGDRPLVAAIAASVDRGWGSWNAAG